MPKFRARSPYDGTPGGAELVIDDGKLKFYRTNGMLGLYKQSMLVELVTTTETIYIFKGWNRETGAHGFIYVGQPKRDYTDGGVDVPATPGLVFSAFVLADNFVVDHWSWRRCEEGGIPNGFTGELTWQR